MTPSSHPLAATLRPLLETIGGTLVPETEIEAGDVVLEWEGSPSVGVRLTELLSLDRLVSGVEDQMGAPLSELGRADKQRAIRILDERGAFLLRKSIEDVGEVMGVSRITIYNYLNATKNGDTNDSS